MITVFLSDFFGICDLQIMIFANSYFLFKAGSTPDGTQGLYAPSLHYFPYAAKQHEPMLNGSVGVLTLIENHVYNSRRCGPVCDPLKNSNGAITPDVACVNRSCLFIK